MQIISSKVYSIDEIKYILWYDLDDFTYYMLWAQLSVLFYFQFYNIFTNFSWFFSIFLCTFISHITLKDHMTFTYVSLMTKQVTWLVVTWHFYHMTGHHMIRSHVLLFLTCSSIFHYAQTRQRCTDHLENVYIPVVPLPEDPRFVLFVFR